MQKKRVTLISTIELRFPNPGTKKVQYHRANFPDTNTRHEQTIVETHHGQYLPMLCATPNPSTWQMVKCSSELIVIVGAVIERTHRWYNYSFFKSNRGTFSASRCYDSHSSCGGVCCIALGMQDEHISVFSRDTQTIPKHKGHRFGSISTRLQACRLSLRWQIGSPYFREPKKQTNIFYSELRWVGIGAHQGVARARNRVWQLTRS